MKLLDATAAAVLAASLGLGTAHAQLRLVPSETPQSVFCETPQTLSMTWRNSGGTTLKHTIHSRIFQVSSATAAPFGEVSWKELEVLPKQTVLESATLTFPLVRAETRFLIQWLTETNQVLGTTGVVVYPRDLLKELKLLAGEEALGILDPLNRTKPALVAAGVEFLDLVDAIDRFTGKLAILGPFESRDQFGENVRHALKPLVRNGLSAVCIVPLAKNREGLKPSFETLLLGKGAVIVVEPVLLQNLADNPDSQRNLIRLSRLALNPEPVRAAWLLNDHLPE